MASIAGIAGLLALASTSTAEGVSLPHRAAPEGAARASDPVPVSAARLGGSPAWAGERYGAMIGPRKPAYLKPTRNGSRLADYIVLARVPCSDGRSRTFGIVRPGERPTQIGADGSFSHSVVYRFRMRLGGKLVRVRFRIALSGTFALSGQSVTGSIAQKISSRRVNCEGTTAFTAFRGGSPQAPLASDGFASGRYRIGRGSATTFAPSRLVRKLNFRWKTRCDRGGVLRSRERFTYLVLNGKGITQLRFPRRYNLGNGLRSRERVRLKLRFRTSGGRYVVRGRFKVRSRIVRNGRRINTCRTRLSLNGSLAG